MFRSRKFSQVAVHHCGPAKPSFSLTYQSSSGSMDTTHTTVDYGALGYGSGNSRVVVAVQWVPNAGSTITGITVGGVALSQVSGAYITDPLSGYALDAWESTGPLSGSSGDVQVTYSATVGWASAVALYNLQTPTPTPATVVTNTAPGSSSSISVGPYSIPAGGGSIVMAQTGNGQPTLGFTNAVQDVLVSARGNNHVFAHSTATGSVTVTANFSASDDGCISAVAWGP